MLLRVKKVNYRSKEDKKISISIISPFVILMIQSLVLYYFNIMDTAQGNLVQLISKIIVGLIFMYSLPIVLKRSNRLFIFMYSISIFIFSLNYLFFNQNAIYLKDVLFQHFFVCLPCFIYSMSIKDKEILKVITKRASLMIYSIGVLIGILIFTKKMRMDKYSMSIGYYMLLPTIVYINQFFEEISIKYAILSIISTIITLAIGSRGPIMCIGIYVVFYQIINFKRINVKGFFINILIIISALFGMLYLKQILISLSTVLSQFGIHSRSIILFLQGEVNLSGREDIYGEILCKIKDNPITGIGIAGDRLLTGTYSHNIIIEVISGFGVLIGLIILIILGIIVIKSLRLKAIKDANQVLIWIAVGLVPLFVSGSYLTYFQLWIFMGIAIGSIKDQTKSNVECKINSNSCIARGSDFWDQLEVGEEA